MPKNPSYPSLFLAGPSEQVETALSSLLDSGCLGSEEIDGGRQRVYFSPGTDLSGILRALRAQFPRLHCLRGEPLPDRDWLSASKKAFHGFALGRRFFVLPSWEPVPDTERIVLRIDPERAFGTGTHDTTRLCLELLEDSAPPGMSLIDAGTGTGLLAMAGAALGCRPVVAIENDSDAAACAQANLRRNHLADWIELVVRSIGDAKPLPASTVVANLSWSLLREHWIELTSWVRPAGLLIVSGLLSEQLDPFVEGCASFQVLQQRTSGEWAAVLMRRL